MGFRQELRFMECEPCKAKAGTAELCEACLNNRAVISRLGAAASSLDLFIASLEAGLRTLKQAAAVLEYPKGCVCKKPWFENPECPKHGR